MTVYILLYLVYCLCFIKLFQSTLTTRGAPPIISSITPSRGGVEGGTRITIAGYNFKQMGLFSNQVVFIGDGICKILNYYTTDGQIQCITPRCTNSQCLSSPNWQGSIEVPVLISIQTVEGIFTVSSKYTYSGYYTPQLLRMSHYTWGTVTSYITGRIAAYQLEDVSILFDSADGYIGNRAFIGDPNVLNDELYKSSWWQSNGYSIYYRPPEDLTAGFYNLTLNVQDLKSQGYGNGIARTFPSQIDYSYANWDGDFTLQDNFDSSLSGTVYSVVLLPAISRVYPAVGSLAGGQLLTISGYGFSKNVSKNIVYAGGELCSVVSATFNTIECVTNPIATVSLKKYIGETKYSHKVPLKNNNFHYNYTRRFGSTGWWIKVWDWKTYVSNTYRYSDDLVRISVGLKQGLAFGFYYNVGSNWPNLFAFNNYYPSCSVCYAADYTSVLVAHYTGVYIFHMNSDDSSYLYGSRDLNGEASSPEVLLMSVPYSTPGDFITQRSRSSSLPVRLSRGERYHLRVRLLNTGGPDYVELALEIAPDYNSSTGYLVDGINSLDSVHSSGEAPEISLQNPVPLTFPDTFLHHHSLKDIQLISLSMAYKYEIQVTITYN